MNVLIGATNYVTGALGLGSSSENSGALDVMVVEHEDGAMSCTPFHVRFSKVNPTNSKERVIQLRVNGRTVPLCMKLGAAGEAFFVERVHNTVRRDLVTSPLSSPVHGDGKGEEGRQNGQGQSRQERHRHPWDDSPAQQEDNWSARQLRNYQLLSDLSSDDEAATYRDSFSARTSGEFLGTGDQLSLPPRPSSPLPTDSPGKVRPPTGSSSPKPIRSTKFLSTPQRALAAEALISDDSETESHAATINGDRANSIVDIDGSNEHADDDLDDGGMQRLTIDGVGGAGSVAASALLEAARSDVRDADDSPARPLGAGESTKESFGYFAGNDAAESTVAKDTRKWSEADGDGDGDEEDNADGGEEQEDDANGCGASGDEGHGEHTQGREGDEGSWWWSWTWGTLPVRKKPKSIRRKNARRAKSRKATAEGVGDSPKPDIVASESKASPPTPLPSGTMPAEQGTIAGPTSEAQSVSAFSRSQLSEDKQAAVGSITQETTQSEPASLDTEGGSGDIAILSSAVPSTRVPVAAELDDGNGTSSRRDSEKRGDVYNEQHDHLEAVGQEASSSIVVAAQIASSEKIEHKKPAGTTRDEGNAGDSTDCCIPVNPGRTLMMMGKEQPPPSPWIGRPSSVSGNESDENASSLNDGEDVSCASSTDRAEEDRVQENEQGILSRSGSGITNTVVAASDSPVDVLLRKEAQVPGLRENQPSTNIVRDGGDTPAPEDDGQNGESNHSMQQKLVVAHDDVHGVVSANGASSVTDAMATPNSPPTPSNLYFPRGQDTISATTVVTIPLAGSHAMSPSSQMSAHYRSKEDSQISCQPAATPRGALADGSVPATEAKVRAERAVSPKLTISLSATESSVATSNVTRPARPPRSVLVLSPDSSPASPSGSSAGSAPEQEVLGGRTSRHGSMMDLHGFHTPQGGSATDLFGLAEGGGIVGGAHAETAKVRLLGVLELNATKISTSSTGSAFARPPATIAAGAPATTPAATPAATATACSVAVTKENSKQNNGIHRASGTVGDSNTLSFQTSEALTAAVCGSDCGVLSRSEDSLGRTMSENETVVAREEGDDASAERDAETGTSDASEPARQASQASRNASTAEAEDPVLLPARTGGKPDLTSVSMGDGEGVKFSASESREVEEDSSDTIEAQTTTHAAATGGLGGVHSKLPGGKSSVPSSPVMSLSGHIIGPEMRGSEGGEKAHESARRAFVSGAVTWDHFSRYSQEVLRDPRLLVAIEGRLFALDEAMPHLIANSVFGRSLLQLSSAIVPESPGFQTGDSLVGGHGSDNVDTDGDPSTSNSGIRGDSTGADVESLRPSLMPSGIQLVTDSNGTDNGIGIDNHGGNFVSSGGIVDETACHGEKGDAGVDGNTGVVGGSKHGKSQSGDGDGANQERDSDPSGEVAGPWWGVGGWFSRRSGMSPPPPTSQPDPPNPPSLGLSSPRASGSAGERGAAGRVDTTASERAIPGGGAGATDGAVSRRKDVDGEGGHRGRMKDSRASHEHLEEMEDATLATNGVDGESGDASHPHGDRGIPMPLSIEVVGKGHAPMVGGVDGEDHHDDDEDEDMYGKTLRPTSEQLVSLKLRMGCNTVEFVAKMAGQAERVVSARVFLWGSGAKVVVSDIESTIARSGGGAGIGSFTPVLGPGVHKDLATLFSKVAKNGYKILYLTSRPLADWHAKKGLEEGGTLPRGPVLCSPEALFRNPSAKEQRSHHKEVFRMTALRGLKLVFPADVNPLYACFGNSLKDILTYKKMAVPEGRIFVSNGGGDLYKINHTYRQTYLSLSKHVDLTFPPLPDDGANDHNGSGTVDDGIGGGHNIYESRSAQLKDDDHDGTVAALMSVDSGTAGGSNGSYDEIRQEVGSVSSTGASATGNGTGSMGTGAGTGQAEANGDRDGDHAALAKVGMGVGTGSGTAPPSRRRCEEAAVRGEKSFYPNRAAVEDQFTDLYFWRDPPPLISDDDLDEEDVGEDSGD